jgi:hypothetical protein
VAFNQATRQNWIAASPLNYAPGQTVSVALPKVGLIRRLICLLEGTATVTLGGGTAALGAEGPWNLIRRIRLVANGNTALFDCSGYGAMIASLFSAYGFSGYGGRPRIPDSATVPGPSASAMAAANFAAGVANGNNAWRFGLEIPLALSDDWRDPIGLILAAAPDTVLELQVTWAAAFGAAADRDVPVSVAGGASATFAGSITPFVEFFTIPASPADYPDLRRIHIWSEVGPQPIVANGPQDVVLQRGNTLMRVVHLVWTNNNPDGTNVTERSLIFNAHEVPYRVTRQLDAYLQRERYARDLPDGVYVWDLWNSGTPRDAIQTLALNEITSRLTLSGATIAPRSDIRTLTEQLISLTGQTTGSA